MSENSAIEWTDATWNPVVGCEKIAQGCKNCYAKTLHDKRHKAFQAGAKLPAQYAQPFETVQLMPERLSQPLKWRKPRRIFVNSVSDLFHESVPFEFIAAVFGVMAACPQHTFQVLTKRPARMREFFEWLSLAKNRAGDDMDPQLVCADAAGALLGSDNGFDWAVADGARWPLKHVWLGTSISTQPDADRNIQEILQCPAAVHFVSAEPLLEDVSLWGEEGEWLCVHPYPEFDADNGAPYYVGKHDDRTLRCSVCEGQAVLDWVIVGGESGPGARPCDVAWIRSIVQQCKAAGVPVFVKQLGSRAMFTPRAYGGTGGWFDMRDPKGGNPEEWPEDLRVREFPNCELGERGEMQEQPLAKSAKSAKKSEAADA